MKQKIKKGFALFLSLIMAVGVLYFVGDSFGYSVLAQEPVDEKANRQVKNIINYLNELSYANRCVLGAFDHVNGDTDDSKHYYDKIEEKYGVTPAMYSCHYVIDNDDGTLSESSIKTTNDTIKEHYSEGALCLVHLGNSWHKKLIAGLSDSELASDLTSGLVDFIPNCDAENRNRNTEIYNGYLKILKTIGDALEDLQNAGITVIYRPFVEMTNPIHEGYCTSEESLESFKRVWRQHYDYLVNERGLHNLVWCFAPQGAGGANKGLQYYPGNDYVDIIGITSYPGGATGADSIDNYLKENSFDGYYQLGKPFGFSEIGIHEANNEQGDWAHILNALKNTLPSVSFANIWSGLQGVLTDTNTNAEKFLKSSFTVKLNELPEKLQSDDAYSASGVAAAFSSTGYGGEVQMLPEGEFTSAKLMNAGIDVNRLTSIRLDTGYGIIFYTEDNFRGKAYTLVSDTQNLSSIGIKPSQIKSMQMKKVNIENASLEKPVISSDLISEPEYINDGTLEFWETYNGNPCWVVIDLKNIYLINRWEVQNIGAYGEGAAGNASDYRLQYSLDCKNWKDADVVFGNTSSVTSQKIEQVSAQYVRLYVTRANSTDFESERDRCAICEFTVYGVKLSAGRNTDWTLMDLSSKSESGSSYTSDSSSSDLMSSESSEDAENETNSAENTSSESESKPSDSNKEVTEKSGNGALVWIIIGVCAIALIGGAVTFIVIKKHKIH